MTHYHIWSYGIGSWGKLYNGRQVDETEYTTVEEASAVAQSLLYTKEGHMKLGVSFQPKFCTEEHDNG